MNLNEGYQYINNFYQRNLDSHNVSGNIPLNYQNDLYKRTSDIINRHNREPHKKFNSLNNLNYNYIDNFDDERETSNDITKRNNYLESIRNNEYINSNISANKNNKNNNYNYNNKPLEKYHHISYSNLNYDNSKNKTIDYIFPSQTGIDNFNELKQKEIKKNINLYNYLNNISSNNYIKSLKDISSLSKDEQIEKLFDNNLQLQKELTHLKNENEIFRNEIHSLYLDRNKKKNNKEEFKNFILEENDKLNKLCKINELLINNLIKKVNSLSKNKKDLINYSNLLENPEKILNLNQENNNNIKTNNSENNKKLKSKIPNDLTERNYKFKTYSKNRTKPKIKKKKLSLNNINYQEEEDKNKNEYYNYYENNGKDRIKTCYSCLFGNNNNLKGYSPLICSKKFKGEKKK